MQQDFFFSIPIALVVQKHLKTLNFMYIVSTYVYIMIKSIGEISLVYLEGTLPYRIPSLREDDKSHI
jgi:hypothetical protein